MLGCGLGPPLRVGFVFLENIDFNRSFHKKRTSAESRCLSFWIPRAVGPLHPSVIPMLSGNEFRLRQDFRLRRKRLYAAKAAPAEGRYRKASTFLVEAFFGIRCACRTRQVNCPKPGVVAGGNPGPARRNLFTVDSKAA